ncbi:hypothetical protein [Litoreibacter halocynthiae]|uniref:hypothetical protein n=1 Tax=Litoreibacter halocynthiae TaxID=1242689 RepID=UPI00248FC985|nr:hypothetical protein [Litoreibacter halocynthiae]
MGILIIAAIILFPLYAGLSAGLVSTVRSRLIYGIAIMVVSGALEAAFWLLAQSATGSASVILLLPLIFFAVVFLIGLGLFIGHLIKFLPVGNLSQRIISVAAFALPAALVGWGMYTVETVRIADEKTETAARADFLNQTLTASFGEHLVTLPVVPWLQIVHACRQGTRSCHTNFWSSSELNMASPDTLELFSIKFEKHSDVIEEWGRWCAEKPEVSDGVWCEGSFDQSMSLNLTETTGRTHYPKRWKVYPAPKGTNLLTCAENWNGLSCNVNFDVASGIQGSISTLGLTPEQAAAEALKALPKIARIWATMLNGA